MYNGSFHKRQNGNRCILGRCVLISAFRRLNSDYQTSSSFPFYRNR
nr:MAG TPA: hypothetical protein [Caudoviricetes sp.]